MKYIKTESGIHFIVGGVPFAVSDTHEQYDEVVAAIKDGKDETAVVEILEKNKRLVEAALNKELTEVIRLSGGQLYHGDVPMATALSNRVLQMVQEGFDVAPMVAFINNLMDNPSKRVVDHLYAFLEKGKSPITEDGCFLVYKAVRADFKDIHSGTFDNSVGQVVRMPRNRVDENPERTCSSGLHVCSFGYLPNFSHADGHVVVCKVNPKDVVAIPADYNNTKMRVSCYEVVSEYKGYYGEERSDVLGNTAVATTGDEMLFSVTEEGNDPQTRAYATLVEAAEAAENALDDPNVSEVSVRNLRTGAVIDFRENLDYVDTQDDTGLGADESLFTVRYLDADSRTCTEDFENFDDAVLFAAEQTGTAQVCENNIVLKTIG